MENRKRIMWWRKNISGEGRVKGNEKHCRIIGKEKEGTGRSKRKREERSI